MKRSQSDGIALSRSDTRYQLGRSRQPTADAGSLNAAAARGRWLTAIGRAMSSLRSAQKVWWNCSILMNRSGPPAAPGASYGLAPFVVASMEGGKGSITLAQPSPSSGAKADRYTSARTSFTVGAAWEITAPPYEWPTRTIGPSIVVV